MTISEVEREVERLSVFPSFFLSIYLPSYLPISLLTHSLTGFLFLLPRTDQHFQFYVADYLQTVNFFTCQLVSKIQVIRSLSGEE